MSGNAASVVSDLRRMLGEEAVLSPAPRRYLGDETETRGIVGSAEAVALPGSPAEVAAVVALAYESGTPVTPRGGGTGFAGGCVPTQGGIVISLERLARIRTFDPLDWRMAVDAGVRTAHVQRLALENGLFFPPDPGAAESSQIGGNVATNAGGPHAFKYGVTGAWVTGLEVVLPPGRIETLGGAVRKNVAGYDLRSLLIGSEGTLGIVTGVWLRLVPAPESRGVLITFHSDFEEGCVAIEAVRGSGLVASALEFLDDVALQAVRPTCPVAVPDGARFMVLSEVDGSEQEVLHGLAELREILGPLSISRLEASTASEVRSLWSWRDSVSGAVTARCGGKVSEDVVVPVDRLADGIRLTSQLGREFDLPACSWGHAGDGNLHSTFLVAPDDVAGRMRAQSAAFALFEFAAGVGGALSGEHGLGVVKRDAYLKLSEPAAIASQQAIKSGFDPEGLMNPGTKI